jgi:multisubunit Na+/H+ antiporter MnhB subunit
MNTDRSQDPAKDAPRWPTSSILLYGTFGARTPAGRRYHVRCGIALAAIVAWVFLAAALSPVAPRAGLDLIAALVPGVGFIYIAWEFRKYLLALDELAKRIQLESIAWTYLTGLGLAVLVGGLAMLMRWWVNPIWFVVLEPVRAGWLYLVSRRY